MAMTTMEYPEIGEKLHIYEYSNGLKAFLIPMKGRLKKYAAFAVNYGSVNNTFIAPGDMEPVTVPDGTAHFLEHKLFEQKNGNVMDKFSALGSSPNAYTGFSQTAYLFSCTDRFRDNYRLLTGFVRNPYITEESVEKEKRIIAQEINMYADDPDWRGYFGFLNALYQNNPVRIDIAGTVESIGKISRDTLLKCYNTFYIPANMVIAAAGDIDPDKFFEWTGEALADWGRSPRGTAGGEMDLDGGITRIFPEEPKEIAAPLIEHSMSVSAPIFTMGYKDPAPECNSRGYLMRRTAVGIILEILMGKSSNTYGELYSCGLINETFDSSYTAEVNYGYSMFGGESPEPDKAGESILESISKARKAGLPAEAYRRLLKAAEGSFVRRFNSAEGITNSFISGYFKGVSLFDNIEIYKKISYDYVSGVFEETFNDKYLAMSVIKPLKGGD